MIPQTIMLTSLLITHILNANVPNHYPIGSGNVPVSRMETGQTEAGSEVLPETPGQPKDRTPVAKPEAESVQVQPIRPDKESPITHEQGEIIGLIKFYASKYRVPEERALRIADAESGFNPLARNKTSRACGVYQYLPSTWANTPEGRQGYSCEEAEKNIEAAIRHMSVHGYNAWDASRNKWE